MGPGRKIIGLSLAGMGRIDPRQGSELNDISSFYELMVRSANLLDF